jgi:hypothetical protein
VEAREPLAQPVRVAGQPCRAHELRREDGGHSLLPAADEELLGVLRLRPANGTPSSANARLNASRCPSRSDSARTPSQSRTSAVIRRR